MRDWLRSYLLLLRWTALRLRYLIPMMALVQTLIAVAVVVGMAYLVPHLDPASARYLATGAPTIGLITVGLVLAPQMISQQKTEGTFDYERSLPVPPMARLAADTTVWLGVTVPGLVLALLVARLRFDLEYSVSPLVVPAFLLVGLTAVAVGYGMAYALPPMVTVALTQVIVVGSLVFSPINAPADRFPGWLQAVHQVLPLRSMADVVRDTLTMPPDGIPPGPFLVLAGWCLGGMLVTYRVLTRRP